MCILPVPAKYDKQGADVSGKSVYGVATGRNYIYNAQLQIVNPHIENHEVGPARYYREAELSRNTYTSINNTRVRYS